MPSAPTLVIGGVTLAISCEVDHTITEGGEAIYEVAFDLPIWTVTTSGAGFSNTETYQQDEYGGEPSALIMIQDAKTFLEEKIAHADTTRANATVLLTALAEMENSAQLEGSVSAFVNLAHVNLRTEVDAMLAQIEELEGIYALSIDAPTASITDTAQAIVNAQLNGSTPVTLTTIAAVVAAAEE